MRSQSGILRYEDRVLVGKVLEGFLLTKQDVTHVVHIVWHDLLLGR